MRRRLSVAYVLSLLLHLLLVLFFGVHLLVPVGSSAAPETQDSEAMTVTAEQRAIPAPRVRVPAPLAAPRVIASPVPQRIVQHTPAPPPPKTQPPQPSRPRVAPRSAQRRPELAKLTPDGTPQPPTRIAVFAPLRTSPPTREPSPEPSETPTALPPSASPLPLPTRPPTPPPSPLPTAPTVVPTRAATAVPTLKPTAPPSPKPTALPTPKPTVAPTLAPTAPPTVVPTRPPTQRPTLAPTERPTLAPTARPTLAPTERPTLAPSARPTLAPTERATLAPTARPTLAPTARATFAPTAAPATAAPVVRATAAQAPVVPAAPASALATSLQARIEPSGSSGSGHVQAEHPAGGPGSGGVPGSGRTAAAAKPSAVVGVAPAQNARPAPIASGALSKLNDRVLSMIPSGSRVTYSQRHITNDLNAAVAEAEAEYFEAAAPPPDVLAKALYVIRIKGTLLTGASIMYVLKKTTIFGFQICSGWYVQQLTTGPTGGYSVGPCDGERFDPGTKPLPGGLPNIPKPRPT